METNYLKRKPIKSIHSGNKLSQMFFSKENIDLLQDLIRHTVWERSNRRHVIGRQSDLQLKIICSVFPIWKKFK